MSVFDVENRLAQLCEALEAGDWGAAAVDLQCFLESSSYDAIELLVKESTATMRVWVVILVKTNLYSECIKGKFFFQKLCLHIWRSSTLDNRWKLLMSVLYLYGFDFNHRLDESYVTDLLEYIYEKTSIPVSDVMELFVFRVKTTGAIVSSLDCSVH